MQIHSQSVIISVHDSGYKISLYLFALSQGTYVSILLQGLAIFPKIGLLRIAKDSLTLS